MSFHPASTNLAVLNSGLLKAINNSAVRIGCLRWTRITTRRRNFCDSVARLSKMRGGARLRSHTHAIRKRRSDWWAGTKKRQLTCVPVNIFLELYQKRWSTRELASVQCLGKPKDGWVVKQRRDDADLLVAVVVLGHWQWLPEIKNLNISNFCVLRIET